MNLKIIFPFLCFVINFSFGQHQSLFDKTLKKDSISSEFTQLYNLTNTIHPGQFMFCSKKEFDKTYLDLKNSIKGDLSVVEYYKLTATLMAKIKDGHTTVDRGQITTLLKEKPVFPFSIYQIKNKYYFDNSIKENNIYSGLQILKINVENIDAIVKEVKQIIHLEGSNETGLNTKFKNFPFYYFIHNPGEKFEVEFIDKNNQKQKVALKGITLDSFTKSTADNIQPLTTEIRKDKIAVLKFHSFVNGYNEADRKIAQNQLDIFFAKLDSLKTKNLIIDLRDNGGGAAEISNYLFSYLIDRPYDYFDYVGAKYNSVKSWKHYAQYPESIEEINLAETKKRNGLNCFTTTNSATDFWWFKKQQNKPNFYKGHISVLINGGCFSTTGHLLALMREYKIGKFYGEYSQGSNYSNAGGQAFVLPYSKTLVWIPILQYKMKTPNFKNDPKGIKPDVEVPLLADDLKTGFDRQMDFVVKTLSRVE
ncbi:S41 family peptidase [Flavobacterium cerinum]|uniref:S41 family peptidase n=1 Tax=Flavobacterium cerinum TaxID=2502784 RepID=A0ABY5IS68_9FLAO|nr:S41 family peptidase [Flavobacterium cerinum]UUC45131.1 S41 family peptidase [Flavobacterium cerinum]